MKTTRFAGALVALTLVGGLMVPGARAEVPDPLVPPEFAAPLVFTNLFFPFDEGAEKVFTGSDHGTKTGANDFYLPHPYFPGLTTRTFKYKDALGKHHSVETHILVEEAYEDEELVERSFNYFAQADDRTVYYFGEVVDNYENGVIVNHDGSWLVGGATPSDPPGIGNAPEPAVFMPANPELGDVFKPEDLAPIVDETAEVVGVDLNVLVPAGKYDGAIKIKEITSLGPDVGFKWYAPGVGVVKSQSKGETLKLSSSTLVQEPDN